MIVKALYSLQNELSEDECFCVIHNNKVVVVAALTARKCECWENSS